MRTLIPTSDPHIRWIYREDQLPITGDFNQMVGSVFTGIDGQKTVSLIRDDQGTAVFSWVQEVEIDLPDGTSGVTWEILDNKTLRFTGPSQGIQIDFAVEGILL